MSTSDGEYLSLDLWLYSETEKAYQLADQPDAPPEGRFWLPRSLCDGCVKFAYELGQHGSYRFCRLKVAEWKAKELNLV